MGVSGSGKTTIGELLAERLDLPYFDADDYHPLRNKEKMARGEALNDDDRAPWLAALNALACERQRTSGAVISCSALKAAYRDRMEEGLAEPPKWIWLHGSHETLLSRMEGRTGHFMPSMLLQSQLETLEEPERAVRISIEPSPEEIVRTIQRELGL